MQVRKGVAKAAPFLFLTKCDMIVNTERTTMNIVELINKYEDQGPLGLSYKEMNWLFENTESLQLEVELMHAKLRRYQETLLSISNSDTLNHAKRMAKVALD